MANGTSTSHVRLAIAEILQESPGRHEAYLAETAAWALERMGGSVPELGRPGALCRCVPAAIHRTTITITGNTEQAPTRRQVAGALRDEADWLAQRLPVVRAPGQTCTTHVLAFTGFGQEMAVLSDVRSELRPELLREGIVLGEFHPASMSTSVGDGNHAAGPPPWPCFAMRVFIPQHD
jgi:hypothetical protein